MIKKITITIGAAALLILVTSCEVLENATVGYQSDKGTYKYSKNRGIEIFVGK